MGKADKGRLHILSITIQWHEEDEVTSESSPVKLKLITKSKSQQARRTVSEIDADQRYLRSLGRRNSNFHLLPSDRVVLDALNARLPQGALITPHISTRELMEECTISRRQVQICLKRLSDKGLIKRLVNGVNTGNSNGYRYQISKKYFNRHQ